MSEIFIAGEKGEGWRWNVISGYGTQDVGSRHSNSPPLLR